MTFSPQKSIFTNLKMKDILSQFFESNIQYIFALQWQWNISRIGLPFISLNLYFFLQILCDSSPIYSNIIIFTILKHL